MDGKLSKITKKISKIAEKFFLRVLTGGEICSIIILARCYIRRCNHGCTENHNGFFGFQI